MIKRISDGTDTRYIKEVHKRDHLRVYLRFFPFITTLHFLPDSNTITYVLLIFFLYNLGFNVIPVDEY